MREIKIKYLLIHGRIFELVIVFLKILSLLPVSFKCVTVQDDLSRSWMNGGRAFLI